MEVIKLPNIEYQVNKRVSENKPRHLATEVLLRRLGELEYLQEDIRPIPANNQLWLSCLLDIYFEELDEIQKSQSY